MRIYSFVVDNNGTIYYQAENLVWSLLNNLKVKPRQIHLHFTENCSESFIVNFEKLGVTIHEINHSKINKYCNKLEQLDVLKKYEASEYILLDCDVFLLEDLPNITTQVAGVPVDHPNPPYKILEKIFESCNVKLKPAKCSYQDELTSLANYNGGVYIINSDVFPKLSEEWIWMANWCANNKHLFGNFIKHIDQTSFSLAVNNLKLITEELPKIYNFPIHLNLSPSFDCSPKVIHYHRELDNQCLISLEKIKHLTKVTEVVKSINKSLLKNRRLQFNNESFWDYRYKMYGDLGSGLGSRGQFLKLKRDILERILNLLSVDKMSDYACGDGQVTSKVPENIKQIGFDISFQSKEIYLSNRANRLWFHRDISELNIDVDDQSDLNIFLDALIHMSEKKTYLQSISNVLKFKKPSLISGFESKPLNFGPMTYFHEALSDSILRESMIPIPIAIYILERQEIFNYQMILNLIISKINNIHHSYLNLGSTLVFFTQDCRLTKPKIK